jgi:hypothetical protein
MATSAAGHAGQINWGDAPTWLAVAGAFAAALIALRQLRIQQADSERLTRQLERQQANDIDMVLGADRADTFGYPLQRVLSQMGAVTSICSSSGSSPSMNVRPTRRNISMILGTTSAR